MMLESNSANGSPLSSARDERDVRTVALLTRAGLTDDGALAKVLRDDAVASNAALATSIARRYGNRGVDLEDLQQVALLGLVLAVGRFDPSRGLPFAPFARVTIHGELKRHLRDHAWAVRPPRGLHDRYLEVQRANQELTHRFGHAPTVGEIADEVGMTAAQVREAQGVAGSYIASSLQFLLEQQADTFTGDGLNVATVGTIEEHLTAVQMRDAIASLPARDRLIVQLRFGQDLTQLQIGHHLGISQMQVSRLLTAILTRLRDALGPPEAYAS